MLYCLLANCLAAQVTAIIGYDSTSACPPFKVQFADSSLGNPDTRLWDFGNGETSALPNNIVTYKAPGYYTVKLKVQKGASVDSAFKTVFVLGTNANFSYTYTDICTAPAILSFAVNNPAGTTNYHWSFGDGNISIEQAPEKVYAATGKYRVSLKTISNEGCLDSMFQNVLIGANKASFLAPDIVCANDIVVFNNASGVVPLRATWKINGAVFKTGEGSAVYKFTTPGIYTVELAEDFGSCQDELKRQVQVYDKPGAAFSTTGTLQSCTYPSTVRFKNASANAVAYKWYFGDGDSSMEYSPSHTYTIEGQFSPMLVAFNANGCSDTVRKEGLILLGPPVVNAFVGFPTSGCIPFDVKPQLVISTPEPVASYAWDFGDGTTASEENPVHTYTKFGKYNITVTLKTVSGCTKTTFIENAVTAGKLSVPDFTADKTVVCGNEPVQFTGNASNHVTTWQWNLIDTIEKIQSPLFKFKKTGYKTITLSANYNGCVTKVSKPNYILVKPPISAKNIIYDCYNRLQVAFKDTSQQPLTWLWNFGDGTTSANQNPPLHSYAASGQYLVTLTAANAGCTNTDSTYISVSNEKPVFTYAPADGYVCRNGIIDIGVTNPSYIKDYSWDLGDGVNIFSDTNILHAYSANGTYFPSLIVKYTTGCIDTVFSPVPVKVAGPSAAFLPVKPFSCAKDTVIFTDNSTTDGVHDIIKREWEFGDAVSAIFIMPPYAHAYNEPGTFSAKITVTDNNQCSDTAINNVVINALPPVSAGIDSFVCTGNVIQMQAVGAITYAWRNNLSLSCFACASPLAAPLQNSFYSVTGTDANGCKAADSVYIKVIQPFTLTIESPSLDICSHQNTILHATGAEVYNWQPPVGLSNTAINNPVASPMQTTDYTVSGTDSNHCFSQTGVVKVTVHNNPVFTILNASPEVEAGSQNVIATTGSSDISKWYWYPSNGLSCTDCAAPVATVNNDMTYTAVASTSYGCSDTATVIIHLLCNSSQIYIPTGFTPNGDGKNDYFIIKTGGFASLRLLAIYNRAGERVFLKQNGITNTTNNGWDGTYLGKSLPTGVYVYNLEILCNGEITPFKGTITLLR